MTSDTFARDRMLAELRWHTRLMLLKYRVRLPDRQRALPGRAADGGMTTTDLVIFALLAGLAWAFVAAGMRRQS